jgi:hypothetical protein
LKKHFAGHQEVKKMQDGRLMVLTREEKQAANAINIKKIYDLCKIEIKYFDTMNRKKQRNNFWD